MEWNFERCCKINNNDLRFRVGEIVSLWDYEIVSWRVCEFVNWWVLEFVSWWVCEIVSWRVCKFMGSWVYKLMGSWVCKLMYSGVGFPFVHKPMGCSVLRFAHKRNLLSYVGITKDDKQIRTWCLSRYMSFRTTLLSETSKWTIGFKQHTQTFPLTLTCKSALFLLLLYCLIITCNTDEKV